jgi:two-component sensor histidine kinase
MASGSVDLSDSGDSLNIGGIIGRLESIWRHGLKPGGAAALVFAVACVGAALLTQAVLGVDPPFGVFGPHYAAILVATVVAGWSAGALASLLGLIAVLWFFVPSRFLLHLLSWREIADIGIYLMISVIIVAITEHYRIVVRQLREEEHYRQLVLDELRHRIANKSATLEAIIRRELRADNGVLEKISGRLRAVAATDALISNSNEYGAYIGDVLKAELEPYDASRVWLRGVPTRLPPRPAVILALVLHELATNAAKYGALSIPQGRLAISWQTCGRTVDIDWLESGGPPVRAPSRQGFGGKLFQSALDPYHGRVHCEFEPIGLKCHISLTLPADDV